MTEANLVRPERLRDLVPVGDSVIARGLGRSYGDAALNSSGTTVLTTKLDRFVEFDATTGLVRAEAGLSLGALLKAMVPRGWFVPVTPGTQNCTLGGCLAADVHGKNHHRDGTFSRHVTKATLVLASGETRVLNQSDPLFWATAGGMGLTGIIREVELQLIPVETAYMQVKHVKSPDLDTTIELLTDPAHDAQYTVAWIDCLASGASLGRGVFMAGDHAPKSAVPLNREDPLRLKMKNTKPFPIDLPGFALNPFTIKLFNAAYNSFQGRRGEFLSPYPSFFYPLDGIDQWNRMYGKRGFVQYQFVLPAATAQIAMREVLRRFSEARRASFLAVLKRFGAQGPGLLSFPTEGLTLSLDIPMSSGILEFLDGMDAFVRNHGGRIYLAKDSRMGPEMLRAGYPRLDEFCEVRRLVDPAGRFSSDLSRRLKLCP
ncbi:MAG: FAD-binding oxidoreductase [Chthonomonadaceae bacterium]|nr:FAD-binding oxidoreductase [Chthonomonadaceae bacterium]